MGASEATWTVAALAWSGFGFLAGYAVARLGCEVHEVRQAILSDDPPTPRPLLPMRRKGDRRNLALGFAIIALALVTVLSSVASLVRQETAVDCQARYNIRAAEAFDARAKAAGEDRAALNALVREITEARLADDRGRIDRALLAYEAAVQQADERRERSPLPAPPEEVCG